MKVIKMDVEEVFRKLAQGGGGGGGDDDGLSPKARVTMLMEGYGFLNQPVPNFKPGDIIRGKEMLTGGLRDYWHPHIVLELLPKPVVLTVDPESVGHFTCTNRYDMVIGAIARTGGKKYGFVRYYADRRDWEMFPGAESLREQLHS